MPAAAAIPAPIAIAYIKMCAVKKLVVEFLGAERPVPIDFSFAALPARRDKPQMKYQVSEMDIAALPGPAEVGRVGVRGPTVNRPTTSPLVLVIRDKLPGGAEKSCQIVVLVYYNTWTS